MSPDLIFDLAFAATLKIEKASLQNQEDDNKYVKRQPLWFPRMNFANPISTRIVTYEPGK